MTALRRPVAVALDLLVQCGRLRISNRTDAQAGLISAKTADALERHGYAHVLEIVVVATDKGKQAAADGIEILPRRYDHATHACYVLDGCRCTRCTDANRKFEADRKRDLVRGRPRTVDADPVRAHVAELAEHGVGLKTIAKRSGVAHGALWKLVYGAPDRNGPSRRVRTATAEAILAVGPGDIADGARVSAEGTRRRLNELVAAGWSKAAIARHVHGPDAQALQLGRRSVTAGNARKVARLHAAWKNGDIPTEGRRSRWDSEEDTCAATG